VTGSPAENAGLNLRLALRSLRPISCRVALEPKTVNSSNHTHFLRLGCLLPGGSGDHGVSWSDPLGWAARKLAALDAIARPFLNFLPHSTYVSARPKFPIACSEKWFY